MGCESCKGCSVSESKLYRTGADIVFFSEWFAKSWNAAHPDDLCSELDIKNITIVSNEDCNFQCTYCYQHFKTAKRLTNEMSEKIVDFLLDNEKLNSYMSSSVSPGVILEFIGGEPLLNIKAIDYFMEYFKFKATSINHPWALNYMISMSSNGSLFTSAPVQDFVRRNAGHINIGISVDGTKELHDSCRVYPDGSGTYDDVMCNVKEWQKTQNKPTTKMTLAPENLDFLAESILHLFEVGFDAVFSNVIFEDVWNLQLATKFYYALKELADQMLERELYVTNYTSLFSETIGASMPEDENKNWCGGDGQMLAIGTDGKIYPCLRYMEYCFSAKDRKPFVIGHIDTQIDTPENNPLLKELLSITRRSQSTDKCFSCPIAQGCSWCSAFNYDLFGTPNQRATFICDMHKARVLANRYFWQKIYNKLGLDKEFPLLIPREWALEIISEEEYLELLQLTENKKED